jgi:predicted RNA-binding Zn-ribbon protein involved in translation (DUF1610 family)
MGPVGEKNVVPPQQDFFSHRCPRCGTGRQRFLRRCPKCRRRFLGLLALKPPVKF